MPADALILGAIVFAAFGVEASLGFGATVITIAVGSFFFPIATLLPVFVPANMVLSAYLVARHRHDVDARLLLKRVVPFMALGLPAGLLLFRTAGNDVLKPLFGGFVVVLAAVELGKLARPRAAAPRPLGPVPAATLLVLGGVIHGVFGTGGPMAVYVAGRRLADKGRFRATLAALWLILNCALVGTYVATGALTAGTLRLSATLLVPVALGIVVGEWAHRRVSVRVFSALVFALLLGAGAILCVSGRPAAAPVPAGRAPAAPVGARGASLPAMQG